MSHHDRDDLTGEHTIGDAGQAILAILFFTIWIADSFFLNYTTWLNDCIPTLPRTLAGVVIIIISGYLAKTSLSIVFGEVREEPHVIRKGVYKIVRHPMYFSEVLLYLGLLLFSISLAAVVVWIIAIVFLTFISRHEESLLVSRFGDEYRQYMREVPMWIPKIW